MNDMHHFTTAISKIVSTPQEEETIIRGHRLSDLIREQPFVASAFLLLTGRLPDAGEARTLDAVLTACVDHGVTPAAAIGRTFRLLRGAHRPGHGGRGAAVRRRGRRRRRPIGCHDEAGHRRSRRAQRRTRRARRRCRRREPGRRGPAGRRAHARLRQSAARQGSAPARPAGGSALRRHRGHPLRTAARGRTPSRRRQGQGYPHQHRRHRGGLGTRPGIARRLRRRAGDDRQEVQRPDALPGRKGAEYEVASCPQECVHYTGPMPS